MNFYKSAAQALDYLDKHQTSVKGSINAAGLKLSPGETKRVLARERTAPVLGSRLTSSDDPNTEVYLLLIRPADVADPQTKPH